MKKKMGRGGRDRVDSKRSMIGRKENKEENSFFIWTLDQVWFVINIWWIIMLKHQNLFEINTKLITIDMTFDLIHKNDKHINQYE